MTAAPPPSRRSRMRLAALGTALATSVATGAALLPAVSSTAAPAPDAAIGSSIGQELLSVEFDAQSRTITPGRQFGVSGTAYRVEQARVARLGDGVPARFTLAVVDPTGKVLGTQQVTAGSDGSFATTVPGSLTRGVTTGARPITLAVRALEATYEGHSAAEAGSGAVVVAADETALQVENSFVSAVGWVKPGESYPSRIIVTNPATSPVVGAEVVVTAPTGSTLVGASGPGTEVIAPDGSTATWTLPAVPGADPGTGAPGRVTLVLESRAANTDELDTIVWRDLSTTATLTAPGVDSTVTSRGPKVIPPSDNYDTARYGDRPFPIVPVQYVDRDYVEPHNGDSLEKVINDPDFEGSTFNLFQEMSLGQLFPNGSVPSAGVATADFDYEPGFDFTRRAVPGNTCVGFTYGDSPAEPGDNPLYTERITDGVYNLPGTTGYYGSDSNGSAIIGAVAGVGVLQDIDSGCGPTGKLVYDAAAIADPEIDYSDFDTDKDGVVDFFMAVFAGCGGNGSSQLSVAGCDIPDAPYDNVWPHSSSLEYYYTDPETGLPGYTTDDQLKDLEGRKLYYTDATRASMTTEVTELPVMVRVGPYNVNPEDAIDKASVISHEYGHSLGLPDFYSTGGRDTYGDWNLMATDKSQNMDAYARQELGWVVPQVLEPGSTRTVTGFRDSKENTGEITWRTPDGTPYTLKDGEDGTVRNSEMYVAKLPGRRLLDVATFETGEGASKKHTWWSGSGNDFGCAPQGGRNFDLAVPGLASLPEGSTVKLELKSLWDIEWDYDYGYVLTTTDGGESYTSHASEKGYTTPNAGVPGNPNANACQAKFDNGLTGSSGSYQQGTEGTDRLGVTDTPPGVFLSDSYDISDLAGADQGALRFSYATDPGLARPGWFIDDLVITATLPDGAERVLLATDFETSGDPHDGRIFNGGCRKDLSTATSCTKGWRFLEAGAESAQDHAYYLEMRDRSGFDFDSKGQNDRADLAFEPGLYLAYTDEAHGYGNAGTDDPPAQSPLDSTPTPGSSSPNLDDAAFTTAEGRSSYSDSGEGHTDNYEDPNQGEVDSRYPNVANPWRFRYECLGFTVDSMSGNDNGPATSDGDLTGDVSFTLGAGCGEFDYGYVEDDGGEEPGNTAPTAAATADPAEARTGERVDLSASGSSDAETPEDLDYTWDFGDGGTTKDAFGERVSHRFDDPGTYQVTLLVTDPQGLTDTDSVEVVVTGEPQNQAPSASMKVKPKSPFITTKVTLSGGGSTDAETDRDDLVYEWNFGDGNSPVDATGKTVRATFRKPGWRTVSLTVTDEGGKSDTVRQRVLVRRATSCWAGKVQKQGSWRLVKKKGSAPNGDYCDTLGKGKGKDVLKMRFQGPQLDVYHGRAKQGGRAIVFIDGKKRGSVNFKAGSSRPKFRYHRIFDDLGKGKHTVRLVMKKGTGYLEGFIAIR